MRLIELPGRLDLYEGGVVLARCGGMVSNYDVADKKQYAYKHVISTFSPELMRVQEEFIRSQKMSMLKDLKQMGMTHQSIIALRDRQKITKSVYYVCPYNHLVIGLVQRGTWVREGEVLFCHGHPEILMFAPSIVVQRLNPGDTVDIQPMYWPAGDNSRKIIGHIVDVGRHLNDCILPVRIKIPYLPYFRTDSHFTCSVKVPDLPNWVKLPDMKDYLTGWVNLLGHWYKV